MNASVEKNLQSKAMIDKAKCITIHSGNVLYELLHTPDDICQAFCGTVQKWIKGEPKGDLMQCGTDNLCISNNAMFIADGESENREELKITLKIFLEENSPKIVEEAISRVITDLKCEKLDTVYLSIPPTSTCPKQTFRTVKFEDIKAVWLKLQDLVANGVIFHLGVCDFDLPSLKDLYESSKIKPVCNQINLEHCCTPPEELTSYATSCNIELLTHNDPREVLPSDTLQCVLPESTATKRWKATYLAKYVSVVKLRQIVKAKGYFLCIKSNEGE